MTQIISRDGSRHVIFGSTLVISFLETIVTFSSPPIQKIMTRKPVSSKTPISFHSSQNPRSLVCPVIDVIDQDTFDYRASGSVLKGGEWTTSSSVAVFIHTESKGKEKLTIMLLCASNGRRRLTVQGRWMNNGLPFYSLFIPYVQIVVSVIDRL